MNCFGHDKRLMKLSTLMDVLVASALTSYVESKFSACGGMFLVSPPGQFKTSILRCLEKIDGVVLRSDVTTQDLNRIRDEIAAKKIRTLVFLDFQKIFERRMDTAVNVVGNVRALVDEGYIGLTESATEGNELTARATVLAAITPGCERAHRTDWVLNGFARRMLFAVYRLRNPNIIPAAIVGNTPIAIASRAVYPPVNGIIPWTVTTEESELLLRMLRHQHGRETPLTFLQKIVCVMRWNFKRLHQDDRSMDIMKDFAEALGKIGADVEIDV